MDQAARKRALQMIPYGLFVAGTGVGGRVSAWAVSWLTQTSFDPPLVVLAVKVDSQPYTQLRQSGRFSVTVLPAEHGEIAAQFFRHVEPAGGKFGDVSYRLTSGGCPVLDGGLAWWECQVVQVIERGDHHLFVGEVQDAEVIREADALTLAKSGLTYGG